jgi:hypothetical protein
MDNNIFFLVEDIEDENKDNNLNIDLMMNDLLKDDLLKDEPNENPLSCLSYFIERNTFFGEDEIYYETYTIKELMKICQYYGIAKDIKSAKCKKQDIVSTIVFFEGQPENYNIVNKRNSMWAFMKELQEDPKMRAYILW